MTVWGVLALGQRSFVLVNLPVCGGRCLLEPLCSGAVTELAKLQEYLERAQSELVGKSWLMPPGCTDRTGSESP